MKNSTRHKSTNLCYGFNAPGARWKITKGYGILTTNNQGLSSSFIINAVGAAASVWDAVLNNFVIFGTYDPNIIVDGADFEEPDGNNEWVPGNIADPGVIAITITWGIFDGPIDSRQIVEWDQIYDFVDYSWGDATVDRNKMDLQNICTHELGHAAGLTDQYDSVCSKATMYGYASVGQTSKRVLSNADKQGICVLYGECIADAESPSSDGTFLFNEIFLIFFVFLTIKYIF